MFEYYLIDLSAMRVCHAVWALRMAPGVGGGAARLIIKD